MGQERKSWSFCGRDRRMMEDHANSALGWRATWMLNPTVSPCPPPSMVYTTSVVSRPQHRGPPDLYSPRSGSSQVEKYGCVSVVEVVGRKCSRGKDRCQMVARWLSDTNLIRREDDRTGPESTEHISTSGIHLLPEDIPW